MLKADTIIALSKKSVPHTDEGGAGLKETSSPIKEEMNFSMDKKCVDHKVAISKRKKKANIVKRSDNISKVIYEKCQLKHT